MKRLAMWILLLAALGVFAYTLPTLRQFQGPFVASAAGPGPAAAEHFAAEVLGPPILADAVHTPSGRVLQTPEGESLLVISARATAIREPLHSLILRLRIGDATYFPASLSGTRDTLTGQALQPEMWLEGAAVFRLPQDALVDAESIEVVAQTAVAEQFTEQLVITIDTDGTQVAETHELLPVGYGGLAAADGGLAGADGDPAA